MQAQTTPASTIVAPSATLGELAAIMADLTREHPEAGARVQQGAFLAIMGHAESDTGTGWWVTRERDATTQYLVLPQYGTCTCQDFQRHGHLSACKHRICVEILGRLERVEVERDQPAETLIDVDGEPIPYSITAEALAILDEQRQRDAARCPTCHEYKQNGSLYCEGARCVLDTLSSVPQRAASIA